MSMNNQPKDLRGKYGTLKRFYIPAAKNGLVSATSFARTRHNRSMTQQEKLKWIDGALKGANKALDGAIDALKTWKEAKSNGVY